MCCTVGVPITCVLFFLRARACVVALTSTLDDGSVAAAVQFTSTDATLLCYTMVDFTGTTAPAFAAPRCQPVSGEVSCTEGAQSISKPWPYVTLTPGQNRAFQVVACDEFGQATTPALARTYTACSCP
jgi:hypothetical protein